jgi:hypothetical protein
MMATRIGSDLRLLAHGLDHQAITAALGLPPTAVWRAGDLIKGTRLQRDTDAWVYGLGTEDQLDIAASLRRLLAVVEPIAPIIQQLRRAASAEVRISCAVYMEDATPSAYLSRDIIEAVAKLGASLDIDLILSAPG